MTGDIPDDIHDALYINELLRDMETEMKIAELQREKEEIQDRLREAEVAVHIEDSERLADAGFAPASVIGMEELIYSRDDTLYTRAAALKEARG